MGAAAGLATAALFVIVIGAASDRSWDFRDIRSKGEAKQLARKLAAVDWSNEDGSQANSLATTENAERITDMFEDWSRTFNMTFPSSQARQKALRNFKANMQQVRDINMDDKHTWWASGNAVSHLSYEEFAATYLMTSNTSVDAPPLDNWTPPAHSRKLQQAASVNWVAAGKVTPVRKQGLCGCCWAFAATAAIESAYLIRFGGYAPALDLSEQQLVSCMYANGCGSGSTALAISYVSQTGQTTEGSYPYTSGTTRTGGTCKPGSPQAVRLATGATYVPAGSESAFKLAVQAQPTVFYFHATQPFMYYAGGLFNSNTAGCGTTANHAMVLTGYDTTTAARYWRVKNSWGTNWGEAGYARILMTGDGTGPCGMYVRGMRPPTSFTTGRLAGV